MRVAVRDRTSNCAGPMLVSLLTSATKYSPGGTTVNRNVLSLPRGVIANRPGDREASDHVAGSAGNRMALKVCGASYLSSTAVPRTIAGTASDIVMTRP